MRKKFRAPPEKKALSLEKDCRGGRAKGDKAARKFIPFRKRQGNRLRRHVEKTGLHQIGRESAFYAEEFQDKVEGRDLAAHKTRWRKWPDMPLRSFIERQRLRRVWREGRKKRSIFSRRYEAHC